MSYLFHVIFYQPILNLLVVIYNLAPWGGLGLAIILLTIAVRLVLYPLSQKSIKSQKALQDLQPKMDEIKIKYKDNKEEQGRQMMKLYAENKVNPFSSCLPLLVQLPFLFAVFKVLRNGVSGDALNEIYSFINVPGSVTNIFLAINLSERSILLAVLAGVAQFWQSKMMMTKRPEVKSEGSKDENFAAIMNKQMLYFMPAMTVFIGISLPSGLVLYWLATTVLTALQQLLVFRKNGRRITNNE